MHPTVAALVSKAAAGGAAAAYEGAYLCVRAYGSEAALEFTLKASGLLMGRWVAGLQAGQFICRLQADAPPSCVQALTAQCPASWGDAGEPLMCGSPLGAPEGERRYSECTAEGECVCSGQWAKPVPTVFPGAGCGAGERAWVTSAAAAAAAWSGLLSCRPLQQRGLARHGATRLQSRRHPPPSGHLPGLGFESCATPVRNVSRQDLPANASWALEGEHVEPDQ